MFEFQGSNKICIQSKFNQFNSNLKCKSFKYIIAYVCSNEELKKKVYNTLLY